MSSRLVGRPQAFSDRVSRGALFLTSLLILALLSLLAYALKTVVGELDRRPCSANCTIYAAPSGNDKNSGSDPSSPKTFLGAAAATRPGSLVCLLPGTYNLDSSFAPPQSGGASAWIVYKSCGDAAVKFFWTGSSDASPMFKLGSGPLPTGPSYVEFRGLHLDGGGNAGDGFFCRGGHHLRFFDNFITNTGGSGIGSIGCDYLTADHNVIVRNGYMPRSTQVPQWYSWTSGISFNSNQWFDRYPGFHNIISNNVVTGEVDQSPKHSDGNGIILDLSNRTYDYRSADTPPALAINNVVYGNGGRCLEAYTVTNFWFVNNTCYKNVLDLPEKTDASITVNNSHDGYIVNNLVVVAAASHPCYSEENKAEEIRYFANLCFGSSNLLRHSNSSPFISDDPLFARPPDLHANASPETPSAHLLADGLALLPRSPALSKGIDPTVLPGLPKEVVADLKKYIYSDFAGNPRPQGGPFDLGAYQSSQSNATRHAERSK
jgi:Right handed beta helix region